VAVVRAPYLEPIECGEMQVPKTKADNPMACRTNVSVLAVGPALEVVVYRCKRNKMISKQIC
jgi:hypothetical protein